MTNSFAEAYKKIEKDLKEHSRPKSKSKFVTLTRTAKGTVETLPKPKSQLFRTKSEGRNKQVNPTRAKKIKLTSAYWKTKTICQLFYGSKIIADKQEWGWFIHFNKPHRKMTQQDQLELMIQDSTTEHLVHFNLEHKHFIIETLEGND